MDHANVVSKYYVVRRSNDLLVNEQGGVGHLEDYFFGETHNNYQRLRSLGYKSPIRFLDDWLIAQQKEKLAA